MKIFSAQQVKGWDAFTIEHEPISSIDLMERAAWACVAWLMDRFPKPAFTLVCGKGNNGGDGLAIARLLHQKGVAVQVFILDDGKPSLDFNTNLERLIQTGIGFSYLKTTDDITTIPLHHVVVDAMFGSGLNRPLIGLAAAVVQHLVAAATVVSIDLPSGMFADRSSKGHPIVTAHYTLTFQCLKLGLVMPENERFFGRVNVLNIGLSAEFEAATPAKHLMMDRQLATGMFKARAAFSHKGNFGHGLLAGGTKGSMGAAILATEAMLRSGVGLATALVPGWGMKIIQLLVPEAMAKSFADIKNIEWQRYSAIGIGPGLGTHARGCKVLEKVLDASNQPMVLDADALNLLATHPNWIEKIPANSILTPHPKEFERLFGIAANDFERINLAVKKAQALQLYIVLKGHRTLVACPNGTHYFNTTGNPGMATGGSGDVLTGIITGLLCQQYLPQQAAMLGVYLHGLAGDCAAAALSPESMIAGDITRYLGEAFKQLAIWKEQDLNSIPV